MFSPLLLVSKYVTQLDGIDNDQVNEDVLARQSMKLDDDPGHTFAEDSYYPDTPACKQLLSQVDTCIRENIVKRFETYNTWAHILEPNESTMIHTVQALLLTCHGCIIVRRRQNVETLYGRQQFIIVSL